MTAVHCIIVFPFSGLERRSEAFALFTRLVEQCQTSSGQPPILVYDARSRGPGDTVSILQDLSHRGAAEVVRTWGVDTCQDWLAGWGHVFDTKLGDQKTVHRIVLLPGDLVQIHDEDQLFSNLDSFIRSEERPFLLGDFESENPYSTKELIDSYGVFLLIANWFPEAWQAIQALHIRKPRSEFLNLTTTELDRLLRSRAFAYEQTLNMLILKWHSCRRLASENILQAHHLWQTEVGRMNLGMITDDPSARHYRGAIDQIERTERMLRMLWRELKGWNPNLESALFRALMEEYERLDERSTRIRDAARIAIWAQLHRGQE